jgi:hypothetical protein
MRKISVVVGSIHSGAFYLASAIVLSLAVNTFTSAYGTVPPPSNQMGLLLCTLSALVSAIALSTLAWRIEAIRVLAIERGYEIGLSPDSLLREAVSAFYIEIVLKLVLGVTGAVLSIVFILLIR